MKASYEFEIMEESEKYQHRKDSRCTRKMDLKKKTRGTIFNSEHKTKIIKVPHQYTKMN